MAQATVYMPDGKPFAFWDDATRYTRIYYVAREHPCALDDGPTASVSRRAHRTHHTDRSRCRGRESAARAGWAAGMIHPRQTLALDRTA